MSLPSSCASTPESTSDSVWVDWKRNFKRLGAWRRRRYEQNALSADSLSQQTGRLTAIELMRGFAIVLIVASHAIDMFIWDESRDLSRALRIAISNGSIFFVFIAGFLFSHLRSRFCYHRYLYRKCQVVLLPYLIVSIPAIIVFTLFLERELVSSEFYQQSLPAQIAGFYINGLHLSPFWFVPMLVLFYVFSIAFVSLHDHKRYLIICLPLSIAASLYIERGDTLASFVYYLSVYLLGMTACIYRSVIYRILFLKGILLLLCTAVLMCGIYELYFTADTKGVANYLQKIIACFLVLGLFLRFESWLEKNDSKHAERKQEKSDKPAVFRAKDRVLSVLVERIKTALLLLAGTSFGIFFIHSYLISAIKIGYEQLFSSLPAGNVGALFLVAALIIASTALIVRAVQVVFSSYSRYLIGS